MFFNVAILKNMGRPGYETTSVGVNSSLEPRLTFGVSSRISDVHAGARVVYSVLLLGSETCCKLAIVANGRHQYVRSLGCYG
jgi:hypothetical protein